MKLADLPVRLVSPLGFHETEEERKARRYRATENWRQRNREKRNASDRRRRQESART